MTITILQGLIFTLYVGFIFIRLKKIPSSISESWYLLNNKERNLFTLFCWSIGFLMLFQTNGNTPLFFLSGAGLCFVGAATMFKEELTSTVHFTGATIGILSAFAGLIFERECLSPFILFSLIVTYILIWEIENRTFWIEIAAFVSIFMGLLTER